MNLQNKTALITGGSEGLGFALAKRLLEEGAYVIICGRNNEKLFESKRILGSDKITTFRCDITDFNQVSLMVKNIAKLDILINNAGIYHESSLENSSVIDISNVIDINLKGLIYVTKACLSMLKASPESFLINISSTKGLEPAEKQSIYCASKYAIEGFSESLKLDLKGKNVRIMNVFPSTMGTFFHRKAGIEKEKSKYMTPDSVAESIVFALTRNAPLRFDKLVLRNS